MKNILILMMLLPVFTQAQKIEAESFTAMSGVQVETTSDAGGGKNIGYIDAKDVMTYAISPAQAGTYKVSYRIASTNTTSLSAAGKITALPNTGGFQKWVTVSDTIKLTAGKQTFTITAIGGNWNLNWFELTYLAPPAPVWKVKTWDQIVVDRDGNVFVIYEDGSKSTPWALPLTDSTKVN